MERSDFDALLDRYVERKVSEAERVKLEAWLDVKKTPEGKKMFLSKEDEDRLFQQITSRITSVDDVVAFRPRSAARRIISYSAIRIAAAILLLVGVSFIMWYITSKPTTITTIATAGIEKVLLDDGTIVWLHPGSKLTSYSDKEISRHVELTGQALFEVAKDPAHPFTIACGEITARVLGTSFNIKSVDQRIELEVLTGKVNLSSSSDSVGVDVLANEKAFYSLAGELEKAQIDSTEVPTIIAGTEYNMEFENTPMVQVFTKIEKKFNVKLTIDNDQINKCRITADFTDMSLSDTFQVLSELLELEYKINGKSVIVSGSGCN